MNRLASETSPYLRQHADNPVDWYPWGEEAFARARAEDRPVLLSVGYSACHWCHVMAHESFEDEDTAKELNARFVSIKVDREERPDVDAVYMDAVQAMTGSGGWPMTVFLTPDGRPFYGGTYFPPGDAHGMPSFRRVLDAVDDVWTNRRDEVDRQAAALADAIGRHSLGPRRPRPAASDPSNAGPGERAAALLESAVGELGRASTPPGAGSGPPPSSPRRTWWSCACATTASPARRRRSPWPPRRSRRWRPVGSTTTSAAVSPGTPPTSRGRCRTSRRCSTTRRAWCAPTCTPGRSRARRAGSRWCEETIAYVLRELARARRRAVLGPGRRLRRRGGSLLRLDTGRAGRARSVPNSRAVATDWYGVTDAGNFEGAQHPATPTRCAAGAAARRRRGPPPVVRGT